MIDETTEDSDMTLPQRRFGVRLDPGISLGHVITMLPSLFLVIWFLSGKMSVVDSTQADMKQFRIDVTAQLAQLKTESSAQSAALRVEMSAQIAQLQLNTDKQTAMIRTDIANMPGMKERVDQLDKRMDQADSRFDAQSKRLENVQATGIENATNMTSLLRQLGAAQRVK